MKYLLTFKIYKQPLELITKNPLGCKFPPLARYKSCSRLQIPPFFLCLSLHLYSLYLLNYGFLSLSYAIVLLKMGITWELSKPQEIIYPIYYLKKKDLFVMHLFLKNLMMSPGFPTICSSTNFSMSNYLKLKTKTLPKYSQVNLFDIWCTYTWLWAHAWALFAYV